MHHLLGALLTPLLPFIRDEFFLDYTQAGLLLSVYSWVYGISQLPAGYVASRIGLRLIMTIGISGVAVAGILVGLSPSYAVMVVFLAFLGLLGGGYHPSSAPLISELVESNKRGTVLGIHQMGGTTSFFLSPLIAIGIASLFGWRGAFISIAAVTMLFGIFFYLRLERWERYRRADRELHAASPDMSPAKTGRGYLLAPVILGISSYAIILSAISFIPLFAVDYLKVGEGVGAALLSIVHFSGLLAGPLGGYLSDRFGKIAVITLASFIAVPLLYLLPLPSYGWIIYLIAFILGMSMYVIMPVVESCIIEYVPEKNRARVLGIYYFGSRGGAGLLMPAVGYSIDYLGFITSFTLVAVFLGSITLITAVFLGVYRRKGGSVK